jgi:aspartate aminotransferase-like enzyme
MLKYILTPGPVAIPDFVQKAIAKPVIPHRTAEFEEIYADILGGLKYLFQTEKGVTGTLIASGTGGMEILIKSLFREKEEVLVVSNGKFSQRWADFGKIEQLGGENLQKAWGEVATKEEILQQLDRMTSPRGLVLTHCETSTGAILDLEEIAYAVKSQFPDVLIVVDGITSVGAQAFYFDDWQIDAALVASQKALMNPAGTVAYALSEVAQDRLQATDPGDYLNLYNYVQWAAQNSYPFTPPVNLLYGVQAALQYIQHESLPAIWNRTQASARMFRAGLVATYCNTLLQEHASESLTAFFPEGKSSQALLAALKAQGFWLSGGQGPLKGKILRISHMGPLADAAVMEEVLAALRRITL